MSTINTPKASYSATVVDVVAGLLHGPQTAADLVAFSGLHHDTVYRVLDGLHEAGVAYRSGVVEPAQPRPGRHPVVWAMQEKPFAARDVVDAKGVML